MRILKDPKTKPALRTALLVACLAVFFLPVGYALEDEAPLPTPTTTTAAATVSVFDFGFEDRTTITPVSVVRAGESVTFSFDEGLHTATGDLGAFDSGPKAPWSEDPTYTVSFSEPGIVKYFCKLHPVVMHGTIVVIA